MKITMCFEKHTTKYFHNTYVATAGNLCNENNDVNTSYNIGDILNQLCKSTRYSPE